MHLVELLDRLLRDYETDNEASQTRDAKFYAHIEKKIALDHKNKKNLAFDAWEQNVGSADFSELNASLGDPTPFRLPHEALGVDKTRQASDGTPWGLAVVKVDSKLLPDERKRAKPSLEEELRRFLATRLLDSALEAHRDESFQSPWRVPKDRLYSGDGDLAWLNATLRRMHDAGVTTQILKEIQASFPQAALRLGIVAETTIDLNQRGDAAANAGSPAGSHANVNEFIFRLEGAVFRVTGFGQTGFFSAELLGMKQIHQLIQTPQKSVPMLELVGFGAPVHPGAKNDRRTPQAAFDREALKKIRDKIDGLTEERELAAVNGNTREAKRLNTEIAHILAELQRATGSSHKPRDLNNPGNKLRPRIRSTINAACHKMNKAGLAHVSEHFRRAIKADGTSTAYIYSPEIQPCPNWKS